MDSLEIVELVSENLNFRIGVPQLISKTLSLFLHTRLVHQLLLQQNLFLQRLCVFGFGICE